MSCSYIYFAKCQMHLTFIYVYIQIKYVFNSSYLFCSYANEINYTLKFLR